MKKKFAIASIVCFSLAPVYMVGALLLYSRLAEIYQRPDAAPVNLTGLAGLFGTGVLLVLGIVFATRAKR